jgi:hypothetical protein
MQSRSPFHLRESSTTRAIGHVAAQEHEHEETLKLILNGRWLFD